MNAKNVSFRLTLRRNFGWQNAACTTWSSQVIVPAAANNQGLCTGPMPALLGTGATSLSQFWSASGVSFSRAAPFSCWRLPDSPLRAQTLESAPGGDYTSDMKAAEGQSYCLCSCTAPAELPHIPSASCLCIQELCVLGILSMFSFLLPPSSLYFASQPSTVVQGVFGKVKKKVNLGRPVGEIQAEFRNRLRMNEKCPYLLLIPTNPLPSCRQRWAAPCMPIPGGYLSPWSPAEPCAVSQRCHPGGSSKVRDKGTAGRILWLMWH